MQKAAAWFWCGVISGLFTSSLIFLLYLPDSESFLNKLVFNPDFLMCWAMLATIVIIIGIMMNAFDLGLIGLIIEGVVVSIAMTCIVWMLLLQDVMPFDILSMEFWDAFGQIVVITGIGYSILRIAFFGISTIQSSESGYEDTWSG